MMKKWMLLIALPITILGITACSSITEEQKKYTGEWTYCGDQDYQRYPFWPDASKNKFIFNEDGTWKFGQSTGKWGGEKENGTIIQNELDLNITEWKIFSNYSDQITGVEAKIISIKGVKCLKISLLYTYQGFGTMDHSTEGVQVVDKEYSDFVEYYFAKSASDAKKITDFLTEEEFAMQVEDFNERLSEMEGDEAYRWKERLVEVSDKKKLIEAYEFYESKGKINKKQKKFLQLLRGDLNIDTLEAQEMRKIVEEQEVY